MKSLMYLAFLAIVAMTMGSAVANVPSLIGNWTCSYSEYNTNDGFFNSTDNNTFILTITEQRDRIFAGHIGNETSIEKGFAGAIGPDNKSLYITEFDAGYSFGTIISSDEIDLIYLKDGINGTVAIDRLTR